MYKCAIKCASSTNRSTNIVNVLSASIHGPFLIYPYCKFSC